MSNKIYIGNLAYTVTEDTLKKLVSEYGTVREVKLIVDQHTGRSKGFAFITMETEEEANNAINSLKDSELEDRPLKISVAKDNKDRNNRYNNRNDRW